MKDKILIHEFQKNATEKVIVELSNFRGTDVINIRVFYQDGSSEDEFKPSRKGITMSVDLIPELKAAIDKAFEVWETKK